MRQVLTDRPDMRQLTTPPKRFQWAMVIRMKREEIPNTMLADMTGLSKNTISNARNLITKPQKRTIELIARALGLSLAWIYRCEGEPFITDWVNRLTSKPQPAQQASPVKTGEAPFYKIVRNFGSTSMADLHLSNAPIGEDELPELLDQTRRVLQGDPVLANDMRWSILHHTRMKEQGEQLAKTDSEYQKLRKMVYALQDQIEKQRSSS